MLLAIGFCLVLLVSNTIGGCYDPTPAFPLPKYDRSQHMLKDAFKSIQQELESIVANGNYNTTSYSIEVTSSEGTLWSSFHTAREQDSARPGAEQVTGKSAYRIASISKVFTVLGILQQQAEGTLQLDDPVDQYLTELKQPQTGTISWKDITLRSLASQLSGIPRTCESTNVLLGMIANGPKGRLMILSPMSRIPQTLACHLESVLLTPTATSLTNIIDHALQLAS